MPREFHDPTSIRLEFDYVNYHGKEHHYEVHPMTIEFSATPYSDGAHWQLNAQVWKRDGIERGGIRTFVIAKMRNVQEKVM